MTSKRPANHGELVTHMTNLANADPNEYVARMSLVLLEIWNDPVKKQEFEANPKPILQRYGIKTGKRTLRGVLDTPHLFNLVVPVEPGTGTTLRPDELLEQGRVSIRCCADC